MSNVTASIHYRNVDEQRIELKIDDNSLFMDKNTAEKTMCALALVVRDLEKEENNNETRL
jgi:hypothetical protein